MGGCDTDNRNLDKRAAMTPAQQIRIILLKFLLWLLIFVVAVSTLSLLEYYDIFHLPDNVSASGQTYELEGGFTDMLVFNEDDAISVAREATEILGLGNAADEATVYSVDVSNGYTYYSLKQYCGGIPVVGKTMVVATDAQGNVVSFETNAISMSSLSFNESLSSEIIEKKLTKHIKKIWGYISDEMSIEQCSDENKVYYEWCGRIISAYSLCISNEGDSHIHSAFAIVDGTNGAILEIFYNIYDATFIYDVAYWQYRLRLICSTVLIAICACCCGRSIYARKRKSEL